jgi:hypothetical protein
MKINVISPTNNHKTLCPLCIIRQEEYFMHKDEHGNLYCKNCGYIVPLHLDPITDSILEAGNQVDTSIPYGKTVKFTKKRTVTTTNDTFSNPLDAWQS